MRANLHVLCHPLYENTAIATLRDLTEALRNNFCVHFPNARDLDSGFDMNAQSEYCAF
jgi:hypothetical protein